MTLTSAQVVEMLHDVIAFRYGSQVEAARAWGLSPVYVSFVMNGKKPPSRAMLAELGLERVVLYQPSIY